MPYYTEKQIDQARSIDLMTYLQSFEPTELVHVRGNTYCTREHDSLKISNGKWMWWSRGFGGNSALDYLIKVKGMSFMDAMKLLTNEESKLHNSDIRRKDNLLFYIHQIARKQQSPYLIITKHVKVNVKNGLQAPDSVNKRVTMDA